MEDERILEFPYYETSYVDDYNSVHVAFVRDEQTMEYIEDRFKILNCQLITC